MFEFFEKTNVDNINYNVQVAKEMLEHVNNDDTFVKRIITGDETWVWQPDVLTKQQSSKCRASNEHKTKKTRKFQSKIKILLSVFIDYQVLVHHEFIPRGQTVNKEYYLGVMRRLCESIHRKIIHEFYIMTMHRLIRQWLFMNFWQSIPHISFSKDRIRQI